VRVVSLSSAKKVNGAGTAAAAAAASSKQASAAQNAKADARLAQIAPNEDVGRMLKTVPLLSKLSDAERAKLGGAVKEKSFQDGQNIISQGDPGHGFFIIRRGACAVVRTDEEGTRHELATLKDGDVFGEAALINDAKRGATVSAQGPVSTFYLEREDFEALFGKSRLNVQFAKVRSTHAHRSTDGAFTEPNFLGASCADLICFIFSFFPFSSVLPSAPSSRRVVLPVAVVLPTVPRVRVLPRTRSKTRITRPW
jgi:hypothetical protein